MVRASFWLGLVAISCGMACGGDVRSLGYGCPGNAAGSTGNPGGSSGGGAAGAPTNPGGQPGGTGGDGKAGLGQSGGNADCLDTRRDASNCGACGHLCAKGASCSEGVCSASACTGTVVIGGPPYSPSAGTRVTAIAMGDLDRDGKLDVVGTDPLSTSVNALLGQGDGEFLWSGSYATTPGVYRPSGPVSIAMGDLDEDGSMDLAVCNSNSAEVSILLGKADGSFAERVDYPTAGIPHSVAIGDLNRDGRLDLAVAGDQVSVLLGEGGGVFAEKTDYSAGNSPRSIALGDLNRDGRLDLAIADDVSNAASVLLGQADGTFASPTTYQVGGSPRSIALGDLNRDGRLDLAVAGDGVTVLYGQVDGSFGGRFDDSTQGSSIALEDVNSDGRLELIVAGDAVSVLTTKPDGTFTAPIDYAVSASSLADGDVNGDGRLDLVAAMSSAALIVVLAGEADGTLLAGRSYRTRSRSSSVSLLEPRSVALGDLNADGILDLSIPIPSANRLSLRLGRPDGTFDDAVEFATGERPVSVAQGDLNDDGRPDLAVANSGSNAVAIFFAQNDGSYAAGPEYPTGNRPDLVITGDFDQDDRLDLVTANADSSSVSLLLADADGFAPAVTYGVDSDPVSLTAADLNGDGYLDLAVATLFSTVNLLFGREGGVLDPRAGPVVANPSNFHSGAIGDFNLDGVPDLVVGHITDVSVFLGVGDGSFGPESEYAVGATPMAIAVGDYDADGKPDLAMVTGAPGQYAAYGTVNLLFGKGDGSFAPVVEYAAAGAPSAIAAGDTNADGSLDLIAASITGTNVLLNSCR